MFKRLSPHAGAAAAALFVTFLWSTSWVLIKFGLRDAIPPLIFAGLRYGLAFACLAVWSLGQPSTWAALRGLGRQDWLLLVALGLIFYAVTQGTQFLGLKYLPAVTLNLLMTFSAALVAGMSALALREPPTRAQWGGVGLYLVGALVFFYPAALPGDMLLGVGIGLVGVAANAVSALMGRAINRCGHLPPLAVTVASMGIGAGVLLGAGLAVENFPPLSLSSILIIVWLAVVNTAFAFTLWNRSLRVLSALESSLINNLMMVFIPLLAWLFLGENIGAQQAAGLILAGAGILIVQLRRVPAGLARKRR
ncbi:MAG: membrane protein [Chloroflexota bacterium]|nr:MAG: membrane protein [Chloroflexota bacterium]